MIRELKQVMIYVDNVEGMLEFWEKEMMFAVMNRATAEDGSLIAEVAPHNAAETSLVLIHKDSIKNSSRAVDVGAPSLMFATNDVDDLHERLSSKGVKVGDVSETHGVRSFIFSDPEGNHFTVGEAVQIQFD